ncbi:MAG TPA: glutathione transferase GstA [Burkholderiales bacterium]|nr:glutathione transferase GstA [Burkholderiales bacterium]
MKLYYAPGACSLSPHIALCEAGLKFEAVKVDLRAKKAGDEDFLAVNPKGYVPALRLDDGQVLTEGPAIVQYVADQKPDSGLAPKAGSVERYRLQEWLNFISTELHKQFSPLFNPALPDAGKDIFKANIAKRLDWLNKQLEGKQYLAGDKFTVADGYLFVILRWAKGMKMELPAAVSAFFDRVAARPKVAEALKAEGLS